MVFAQKLVSKASGRWGSEVAINFIFAKILLGELATFRHPVLISGSFHEAKDFNQNGVHHFTDILMNFFMVLSDFSRYQEISN